MNIATRGLFTTAVLADGADRVLAAQREKQYLTVSAEELVCQPIRTRTPLQPTCSRRCLPADAVDLIASSTALITLVYLGGKGMNGNKW